MASTPVNKDRISARGGDRPATFLSQWSMFFRQFVKHPGMIGSIIPSSSTLVDSMLSGVDWQRTRLFVEYGPGVGTFTRTILERMHPDATLIAIDLNLDFVAWLEARIADPRLRVVHGSAADVRRFIAEAGHRQADYILSGPAFPFPHCPMAWAMRSAPKRRRRCVPAASFWSINIPPMSGSSCRRSSMRSPNRWNGATSHPAAPSARAGPKGWRRRPDPRAGSFFCRFRYAPLSC